LLKFKLNLTTQVAWECGCLPALLIFYKSCSLQHQCAGVCFSHSGHVRSTSMASLATSHRQLQFS